MSKINLCFLDVMHECSFSKWNQQKHCEFAKPATFDNGRCMHYRFGCFCQNQDAYPTARSAPVKEGDLPEDKDDPNENRGVTLGIDNSELDTVFVPYVSDEIKVQVDGEWSLFPGEISLEEAHFGIFMRPHVMVNR